MCGEYTKPIESWLWISSGKTDGQRININDYRGYAFSTTIIVYIWLEHVRWTKFSKIPFGRWSRNDRERVEILIWYFSGGNIRFENEVGTVARMKKKKKRLTRETYELILIGGDSGEYRLGEYEGFVRFLLEVHYRFCRPGFGPFHQMDSRLVFVHWIQHQLEEKINN